MGEATADKFRQASAIPFRYREGGIEVLLMTSISSGAWILPKGNVDAGNTPGQAAEIEALEEGGVTGLVSPKPLVAYDYEKKGTRLHVQVFTLQVENVLEKYRESRLRRRQWVTPDRAIRLVDSPHIRSVLERFVEDRQTRE